MSNNWKSSVNELLAVFKGTLVAIIPWLEKAKIKWHNEDAYDDWDNIVEALYENIVCSSLEGEVKSNYKIAKYNFKYDDYSDIDFILVSRKESQNENLAFISFQSNSLPLDSIWVAILNNSYKVVGSVSIKNKNVDFKLLKNKKGKKEIVDDFDVII